MISAIETTLPDNESLFGKSNADTATTLPFVIRRVRRRRPPGDNHTKGKDSSCGMA